MKTAQEIAVEQYPTADKREKALLEKLFGKQIFAPDIIKQAHSFETACKISGTNPEVFKQIPLALSKIKGIKFSKATLAEIQAREEVAHFIEVVNQGWVANPKDGNQQKWYPVFISNGSGFVLSFTDYDLTLTYAALGSRFYYENEKLAAHGGKVLIDRYKIIHQYK